MAFCMFTRKYLFGVSEWSRRDTLPWPMTEKWMSPWPRRSSPPSYPMWCQNSYAMAHRNRWFTPEKKDGSFQSFVSLPIEINPWFTELQNGDDLSSSLCKRLPEGKLGSWSWWTSPISGHPHWWNQPNPSEKSMFGQQISDFHENSRAGFQ